MSCSGTYGKISVVPTDAPKGVINQALLKITPDEGFSSEYIKHWMQSDFFQKKLEAIVGGTALQNVPPVSVMKKISIKVPSLDMQIRVIEELDSIKLLVDDLIDNRTEKNLKIKELKNAILANSFSHKEVA